MCIIQVAFNCVVLRAVPYVISAGLLQLIVGVALRTLITTFFEAEL